MKIKQLAVAIAALALAAAAQASDSPAVAKAKLEKVLTCEQGADPEEVATLIKTLGGLSIVQASPLSDAEYTVPNPVELFGRPVTKISIHRGMNADGDFNEYGALFSGESIDTVAKIAGITPDAAGTYRKEVGGHDLILRPEAGATYITCANDVRTIVKTIKRTAKNVGKAINEATTKKE
ncbi:hypothetical protein H5782_11625 [Klebsiella pneumoniae]|nr:hypothetical protein [Klebsiella pneumoniae]